MQNIISFLNRSTTKRDNTNTNLNDIQEANVPRIIELTAQYTWTYYDISRFDMITLDGKNNPTYQTKVANLLGPSTNIISLDNFELNGRDEPPQLLCDGDGEYSEVVHRFEYDPTRKWIALCSCFYSGSQKGGFEFKRFATRTEAIRWALMFRYTEDYCPQGEEASLINVSVPSFRQCTQAIIHEPNSADWLEWVMIDDNEDFKIEQLDMMNLDEGLTISIINIDDISHSHENIRDYPKATTIVSCGRVIALDDPDVQLFVKRANTVSNEDYF